MNRKIGLNSRNLLQIIINALNHIDPRLIDHGTRVAYMTDYVLKQYGCYDTELVNKVTLMALFHDIGAYKTEEIDQMVQFETSSIWEHSIYGYLFFRYLTPLKEYAEIILYHHMDYDKLENPDSILMKMAQIIYLTDRCDTYMLGGGKADDIGDRLDHFRDRKFSSEVIDCFLRAENENRFLERIYEEKEPISLDILDRMTFSRDEMVSYLEMISFSIDFRSEFMVSHTIVTTIVSRKLAELMELDDETLHAISLGALLHDLGKTGIPVDILDHPGKLTDEKMNLMRRHVIFTKEILTDCLDPEIVEIAARHHEKLNGTGYPEGLTADQLTVPERIVAVADIFSALFGKRSYKGECSREKICELLWTYVEDGGLDGDIVGILTDRYDTIAEEVMLQSRSVLVLYDQIHQNFRTIMERLSNSLDTPELLLNR